MGPPVPLTSLVVGGKPSIKRSAPGSSSSSPTTVPTTTTMTTETNKQRKQQATIPPIAFLRTIFDEVTTTKTTTILSSDTESTTPLATTPIFMKPTEEEIRAYGVETVRAIRMGNLIELKRLYTEEGKDLNASNQFGESLIHMACRRGNLSILSFMLREANVRVDRQDDFGRTIIHDACWTSTPNFDIMDELLHFINPFILLSPDVRGSTPFEYCRKDHWTQWVTYLTERKEKLQERIRKQLVVGREEEGESEGDLRVKDVHTQAIGEPPGHEWTNSS